MSGQSDAASSARCSVLASTAPLAAAAEPTAVAEEGTRQPWYKSLWPFGRGGKTEQAAAPAEPAAAPELPAGRTSTGTRGEFAYDSPNRTIRTGVLGECVMTGRAPPGAGAECPGATQPPAPVAIVEPMPAPAPAPRAVEPEPVQVQPLPPEPVEVPRALEPEPVAAPPAPPLPPAPMPQTTTLAADATFSVGSFQLKPSAKVKLVSGGNIPAYCQVKAFIYLSGPMPTYTTTNSVKTTLTTGNWITLDYDFAEAAAMGVDLTKVSQLGVQIETGPMCLAGGADAERPERTIEFDSPEFRELAARLAADGRQGSISLEGDILLLVGGERVLVKGPKRE